MGWMIVFVLAAAVVPACSDDDDPWGPGGYCQNNEQCPPGYDCCTRSECGPGICLLHCGNDRECRAPYTCEHHMCYDW